MTIECKLIVKIENENNSMEEAMVDLQKYFNHHRFVKISNLTTVKDFEITDLIGDEND